MVTITTLPTHGSSRPRHYWMFQANPVRYRIEDSLRVEREEEWNLNQHSKDIAVDDQVLIWICGDQAGVYAVGIIMTEPVVKGDSEIGIGYWTNPAEGRRPRPRVRVRYDRVFLDQPLLKLYIEADPALRDLSILQSARGTNFAVTPDEWAALQGWLNPEV